MSANHHLYDLIFRTVINPRNIRYFVRAKGMLAKTDEINEKLIAEYGYAISLVPRGCCQSKRCRVD